jgi:flagellar biosynthetic protein FlhB
MSGQDQEQNKTEEATPFKLRRAREKGMVARSLDLGFFGGLAALAAFLLIAGDTLVARLAETMRRSLAAGIDSAADPQQAPALVAASYWPALQSVILLGGTVVAVIVLLEIVQLRGIVFTAHPLKPDFSRINPAKGLKRLFSMRMLKEALKNVLKLAAYATVTTLIVLAAMESPRRAGTDALGLVAGMESYGLRLLFLFILVALGFAALDQLLVRKEFSKQMRMSRRELTREHKEREGEPRMKQKRKQLHAEFARQAEGMGKLPGSDLLVVNPEHVAVALAYDPAEMAAPTVTAKGRNRHALALKRRAFALGIPIFENPPLARGLYADCPSGMEIGGDHYRAVADLYFKLRLGAAGRKGDKDA